MTNKQLIKLIFKEGCKINLTGLRLSEKVKIASLIEKYFDHITGIRKHLINDTVGVFLLDGDNYLYRSEKIDDFGEIKYNLDYKDFFIIISLLHDNISLLDVYKALKNK